MYQAFDAFEYIEYMRRRWRVVAVACFVAGLLVLAVSLLFPKHYTATASIVIEPPPAADARTATTVSPIYLESLKTYERFATSDSLFAGAVDNFHLQEPGGSQAIEALKRAVLKVSKPRDTRLLEISVTLRDPKLAQSLAQYIAEETVKMSHGANLEADREPIEEAHKQLEEARLRLERAQKALRDQAAGAPVETLQSEIDSSVELQNKLRQELLQAEADVAEYQQADGQFAKEQLQAARSRVALLDKRSQELARTIQQKGMALASRSAKKNELESGLKMAEKVYETAATRLRELQTASGMHGERLRVIDPGIVPQQPSSPNVVLNVAAALFLALVASMVYLSFAFALRRRAVGFEPTVSRGMRA
jgi:succinoglycan biosynthesis transport protein ExoP